MMKDLSGNGNHASQSTSSNRPTYRTDGTLHWVDLDGVGDHLRGFESNAVEEPYYVVSLFKAGDLPLVDFNAYRLFTRVAETSTSGAIGVDGNQFAVTSKSTNYTTQGSVGNEDPHIGAGVFYEGSTESRLDGVDGPVGGASQAASNDLCYIGAGPASSGTSRHFEGKVLLLTVASDPTSEKILALEAYMRLLQGGAA